MAEKKQKTKTVTKEAKTVTKEAKTVVLSGLEFDVNSSLPESFLESKLSESQKYVPIRIYRDIMRQLGEFSVPRFGEPTQLFNGKNTKNKDVVTFKQTCVVDWEVGDKKIELSGSGYMCFSSGILLSDAIHGNQKTLEARAMRDALKYSYKIFDFAEDELTGDMAGGDAIKSVDKIIEQTKELAKNDVVEKVEIKEKDANEKETESTQEVGPDKITEKKDKRGMKPSYKQEKEEVESNDVQEEEIKKTYIELKEAKIATISESEGQEMFGENLTKVDILNIGKEIKEKYNFVKGSDGEGIIKKIIGVDFNNAA